MFRGVCLSDREETELGGEVGGKCAFRFDSTSYRNMDWSWETRQRSLTGDGKGRSRLGAGSFRGREAHLSRPYLAEDVNYGGVDFFQMRRITFRSGSSQGALRRAHEGDIGTVQGRPPLRVPRIYGVLAQH